MFTSTLKRLLLRARVRWQLVKYRLTGAVNLRWVDPHEQVRLTRERRERDERLLQEWFEAAKAEGIDLSHEAMVNRFSSQFNSTTEDDVYDSNGGSWRDAIVPYSPEWTREKLHRSTF